MIAVRNQKYSFAGLFAGIGGLELGLSKAGHRSEMLCEIDPAAQAVLRHKWKKQEIIDDIRKIKELPDSVNAVCAGFPCQDLSSSGEKRGIIDGDRSSLVSEVFRLVKKKKNVEWLLIENVKFMLHLNGGQAMKEISSALDRLGYNWCYRVVNSQHFGTPQRRHRVFILASDKHDPRDVLFTDEAGLSENKPPTVGKDSIGFYWTEGAYATGIAANGIPPLKGGSSIGIPSPPAVLLPCGRIGTPSISDAERLQGFPKDWTKAAEAVAKSSSRWKLVGNAVTVPVAEWIGERLMAPGVYDATHDQPLESHVKWPTAAWSIDGKRHVSQASERPIGRTKIKLHNFLNDELRPLSFKATQGFLHRANKGSLNFPEGFLASLAKHGNKMRKTQ